MSEVHTKKRPLCGGEIIPKYLGFFCFFFWVKCDLMILVWIVFQCCKNSMHHVHIQVTPEGSRNSLGLKWYLMNDSRPGWLINIHVEPLDRVIIGYEFLPPSSSCSLYARWWCDPISGVWLCFAYHYYLQCHDSPASYSNYIVEFFWEFSKALCE